MTANEMPDRKALLAVGNELNEVREMERPITSKMSTARMTAAILAATDNGKNLKKLTKAARATVTALVEATPQAPAKEAESTPAPAEAAPEAASAAPETPAPAQDDTTSAPAESAPAEDAAPAPVETASEAPEVPADAAPAEAEAPAEASAPDFTSREALNRAAEDMNDVMGLQPGIDTSLPDEVFMKAFTKAADMAAGNDNFKDETWAVLAAMNLGPERTLPKPIKAKVKQPAPKPPLNPEKKAAPAVKKADKPEKAATASAPAKKVPAQKAAPTKRGTGVIASIRNFVAERAADGTIFTHKDVHDMLIKAFPERDEDALMSTVHTQIPTRVTKECGYIFSREGRATFTVSARA